MLGGFSFPPLGAILTGAMLGTLSISSIIFLILKFWQRRQYKALEYLRLILANLNTLNSANMAFMMYMNKSEEEASRVLNNLESVKKTFRNGSKRFRKISSDMCGKAIKSTGDMIDCIKDIDKIGINQWISGTNKPVYPIMEREQL